MTDIYTVTGLGFGDEGKGSIVDALAKGDVGDCLVVRHNGGPQAAHNVLWKRTNYATMEIEQFHHTYSQLCSANHLGARTHLSKYFIFNPINYWREIEVYPGAFNFATLRTISPQARIVTPYHQAANAARERARGGAPHGSCGQGVGEVMADAQEFDDYMIRAYMMNDGAEVLVDGLLHFWRDKKAEDIRALGQEVPGFFYDERTLREYVRDYILCPIRVERDEDILRDSLWSTIIFEGAQGVLLDEDFGFHPHTTWSRTTSANVDKLLADSDIVPNGITRLGLIRAYMTRHGAGPFVTEDSSLSYPEPHNGVGEFQGAFRLGHFDLVALQYALTVCPVDGLVINHLDVLFEQDTVKVCTAYSNMERIPIVDPMDFAARELLTKRLFEAKPIYEVWDVDEFIKNVHTRTGVDIKMVGHGPTEKHQLRHNIDVMTYR